MTPINKSIFQKIVFALSMTATSVCYADIAVVLNLAHKGVQLSRGEVQSIFLGIKTQLPNGQPVTPFDQEVSRPIHEAFYRLVASKNTVELNTYWSRLVFTGRALPPTVLGNGQAILSKVESDVNAIGYVDAALAKAANVQIALLIPTA